MQTGEAFSAPFFLENPCKLGYKKNVQPVGLQRSGRVLFLLFFSFIGSIAAARAQDYLIWTETKPATVFARENVSLRLYFKNSAKEARRPKFEFRLYQIAGGIPAPVGERRKWKEISIGAGQTVVESIKLSFIPVRGSTLYSLKIYDGDRIEEAASLPVLVHPDDLMSEMKGAVEAREQALFGVDSFPGHSGLERLGRKGSGGREPLACASPRILFDGAPSRASCLAAKLWDSPRGPIWSFMRPCI